MGLKRLLLLVVFAAAASLTAVSVTSAGVGIHDDPCPTVAGEHTNTCPTGTTGSPYAIQFREADGSGCGPGKQTFTVDSGNFPPGLTLATSGHVTGTPTQAGNFTFYVKIAEPQGEENCAGSVGEKRFTIPIVSGLAKLTIGPESTSPGTRGATYSLQMTATVSDPKTWSISAGQLPPGLAIDPNSGVISGTPTAAGTYTFEVLARMNGDSRQDTKALGIVIREPLAISASDPFSTTSRAVGEVSLPFAAMLTATGGDGTYTWTLASGLLPPGLALEQGALAGTPTVAGVYGFVVGVADAEGRVATYAARIVVAQRLAVANRLMVPGRVGKRFQRKLVATGGVKPTAWRVVRGPLPRGVVLNRATGGLFGTPKRAGMYRVTFQATDTLGVKALKTFRIKIVAAPKPKK